MGGSISRSTICRSLEGPSSIQYRIGTRLSLSLQVQDPTSLFYEVRSKISILINPAI